jgi:hypothetical protein
MGQADSEFLGLLQILHSRIGCVLSVALLVDSQFFGVCFEAELDRVETIASSRAITVLFSNGVSLDLMPGEQLVVEDGDRLDLNLGDGLVVELSRTAT